MISLLWSQNAIILLITHSQTHLHNHSFIIIHPSIHSFIHSFTYSLIHPFIHQSCTHSFSCLFVCLLIHSLIYLFVSCSGKPPTFPSDVLSPSEQHVLVAMLRHGYVGAIETGVIWTGNDTIAIGHVINGISAGTRRNKRLSLGKLIPFVVP